MSASKRWSGAFKQSLRDSRIGPTEVLAAAVADAGVPVLLNASAVGYYGDTRDRVVDETASHGTGFLAQLCTDWEAATATAAQARRAGGAAAHRTGVVARSAGCSAGCARCSGWAWGLGSVMAGSTSRGSASTTRSVRSSSLIDRDDLSGPVNLTGPAPVTNAEFTAAFGRTLKRPTPMSVPGFALRAVVGEFADDGLLSGQRAIPAALERAGFGFRHKTVGEALAYATAGAPPA